MTESEDIEEFGEAVEALGGAMASGEELAARFRAELARAGTAMGGVSKETARLSNGIGRGLGRAIDGLVLGGDSLADAVDGIARAMADSAYSIAMRPVTSRLGDVLAGGVNGMFGGLFQFADGAGFAQGRVMPFARGGVVSAPTAFPMRGGTGLMGEAGPEAIMPLARGADGRLGVRAEPAARPVSVVVNVSTPDVEGFRRSQGQIAAELGRAIARGARNR